SDLDRVEVRCRNSEAGCASGPRLKCCSGGVRVQQCVGTKRRRVCAASEGSAAPRQNREPRNGFPGVDDHLVRTVFTDLRHRRDQPELAVAKAVQRRCDLQEEDFFNRGHEFITSTSKPLNSTVSSPSVTLRAPPGSTSTAGAPGPRSTRATRRFASI